MYIPAEPLIILIPIVIGLATGNVVWDGSQFTMKEEKPSREAGLKKFNDSYILSEGVKK